VGAAVTLLGAVRRAGADLAAAELIGDTALGVLDLPAPLPDPWPAYVLLEIAGGADDLAGMLAPALDEGDAVLAAEPGDRARLWRYREDITESISRAGVPVKLDVSVPLGRLAEIWAALPGTAGARTVLFGHLAEGNVHVNLLDVAPAEEPAAVDRVLRLVAGAGGSISAEHGIGRAKTRWLHLTRSPAELAAMRAVKDALDPTGILNPGVILT
jgi:FAD/FMN-containing dehydrogenase